MQITIDLTEDQKRRLDETARPLGVSPEALAKAVLTDALASPSAEFSKAAAYVLAKNAELYRRLR